MALPVNRIPSRDRGGVQLFCALSDIAVRRKAVNVIGLASVPKWVADRWPCICRLHERCAAVSSMMERTVSILDASRPSWLMPTLHIMKASSRELVQV